MNKDYFSKDYFFGKKNSNYNDYYLWDNDRFWKSIIKYVEKHEMSGKALDVGCAFGFLLKRLKPFFQDLYGVDISDYAIKKAKEEIPEAELLVLDINKNGLPFPDNYFDFIAALDILEHTDSIEDSLRKIVDKLSPEGYLVITLPLLDTWAGKFFHIIDVDKSHISVPKRDELFSILGHLNLKIIEKHYFLNVGICKIKGIPIDIELVLKKS